MSGAKKSKKFLLFLVLVVLIFAVIWLTVFISNKQEQKKIEKNATYVVTKEIVNTMRELINKETGVPFENISFSKA